MTFSAADGGKVRLRLLRVDANAVLTPDGSDGPVTGPPEFTPAGMTVSLKITGPRTFDLTLKAKGTLVFVDHATVSGDGRTMTIDAVNGPAGPAQGHARIVYARQ